MHGKFSKEVWVKLNHIHEGYGKVNEAKLQTIHMRFEILKMSEEESIAQYFLKVYEVTNMIRGLGEVKEDMSGQKVLRSLPMRFNAKVSSIKEMAD